MKHGKIENAIQTNGRQHHRNNGKESSEDGKQSLTDSFGLNDFVLCPNIRNANFGLDERHLFAKKCGQAERIDVRLRPNDESSAISWLLTASRTAGHPACQPAHSICEKLLAFHCEHKTTPFARVLEDIDNANAQLTNRTRSQERQRLQSLLDDADCRRRRGPQALGKIIPLVLARLGVRALQSEPEGEDSD